MAALLGAALQVELELIAVVDFAANARSQKNAEWRGNEHRNPLFFADWPDLDGKNLPTRIVVGDRLNDAADVLICCDGLALKCPVADTFAHFGFAVLRGRCVK